VQKNTPNELMGRVSGARSLAVQAPQAAGNLVGAGLVLALNYRDLAYMLTLVITLTALYLGTRPTLRSPAIMPTASEPVAPATRT
jgi:hypothetical protein